MIVRRLTRAARIAARAGALVALSGLSAGPARATAAPTDSVSFVVLGHIRGENSRLNPKLGELLDRVRELKPAFVVLTGDIIWGDFLNVMADPATLEREWTEVDSALATLGVPIYRAPGNHDINDVPSRDAWLRRYGPVPAVVDRDSVRLILLSTAWIPPDGDKRHGIFIGGVDLDSAQVGFLRRELARPGARHRFVFTHHLLWWETDTGRWWKEVQPVLAEGKADAVFSGDYGPLKFSTLERDGVRYYQSSIEGSVGLQILQNRVSSRVLSSQFDNFFEVRVRGAESRVIVHTVAEVSSGEFTPARYQAINAEPSRAVRLERAWNEIKSPKRLLALGLVITVIFLAGWLVGRRGRRA